MVHFTVMAENEAGVDLVLIQPFLLYYVNHVVLMPTSIFKHNFNRKRKRFVSKQDQLKHHVHSKARNSTAISIQWLSSSVRFNY